MLTSRVHICSGYGKLAIGCAHRRRVDLLTAENDGMGDPVVCQQVRLLQALGGSQQQALCHRVNVPR